MLGYAHVAFGVAIMSFFTKEPLLLGLAGFISILPDLDKPFGHRAWFSHSLLSALILSLVALIASGFSLMFFFIVFLMIVVHLFLDLFTKSGIPIMYPLRDKTYGLRLSESKNVFLNKTFVLFSFLILAYTMGEPVIKNIKRLI